MERRDRTAINDYSRLLDKVMYADGTQARIDARLQAAREHTTLVEQRDRLAETLRTIVGLVDDAVDHKIHNGRMPPIGALLSTIQDTAQTELATVEQGHEEQAGGGSES